MSRSLSFLDRRRGSLAGAILAAGFFLAGSSSQAVVVLSGSGTGVNPISASAVFQFAPNGDPNLLDITLINTSTVPTRYPADVLTSFYFDICKPGRGGTMISPPLGYVSAVGRVYQVQSGTGDDIPAVNPHPCPRRRRARSSSRCQAPATCER
ncbi:MAG: XDD4 family exosortase-dependent surface protein [Planctomycetota bacterium]